MNIRMLLLQFTFFTHALHTSISVKSIYSYMHENQNISFYKCHDPVAFNYPPLPVAQYPEYHPYQGTLDQTGIFIIKNGTSISNYGYIFSNNYIFSELLPTNYHIQIHVNVIQSMNNLNYAPKKIAGKVATLTRIDYDCYGHWLGEFLGRLALLNMHNIEYDWLYVPYDKPYIQETLALLGIDPQKIIQPYGEYSYIQADELIVPSLTAHLTPTNSTIDHPSVMYCAPWNINWLRETFIPQAVEKIQHNNFSKKVFVSRNDAGQRRMINEDQIFKYFEEKGFTRYCMSNLSFLEQVTLFNQAECIVAAHGSALTNVIFCNPDVCILEIFQNQFDSTFWNLSQTLHLEHHCIKTQDPTPESWKIDTFVDLKYIHNYIQEYLPYLQ